MVRRTGRRSRTAAMFVGLRESGRRVWAVIGLAVLLVAATLVWAAVKHRGGEPSWAESASLVAAYSFDQRSGTTVSDASGNGNDAAVSAPRWTHSGRYGGALQFNGRSTIVTVPSSRTLDPSRGMTLEAWVRPNAASLRRSPRMIMAKEKARGGLLYGLELRNARLRAFAGRGSATGHKSVPRGRWSFVAATYDGSRLRVYLNGKRVANRAVRGRLPHSRGPLRIGAGTVGGMYFAGRIDNVRIYSAPLPAGAISADRSAAVIDRTAAPSPPMSNATPAASPSPSPPPSPSPSPSRTVASPGGCASSTPNVPDGPDPWGGCFPGKATTGVPAGTNLTTYTGDCDFSTDNEVIENKTVNCPSGTNITGANVRFKNDRINGGLRLDSDYAPASASFSVTDSEIDAGTVQLAAVCCNRFSLLRVDTHGGVTAAQCDHAEIGDDRCTITDSYLHGQYIPDGEPWHLGGFLSDGGANITIEHSYVVCDHAANDLQEGCTGDINLIPNFAKISNVLIQHNLLGANHDLAFCTYGGDRLDGQGYTASAYADHVVYRHNIFIKTNTTVHGTTHACGAYGPVAGYESDPTNNPRNVWADNKYDDGTTVEPDY